MSGALPGAVLPGLKGMPAALPDAQDPLAAERARAQLEAEQQAKEEQELLGMGMMFSLAEQVTRRLPLPAARRPAAARLPRRSPPPQLRKRRLAAAAIPPLPEFTLPQPRRPGVPPAAPAATSPAATATPPPDAPPSPDRNAQAEQERAGGSTFARPQNANPAAPQPQGPSPPATAASGDGSSSGRNLEAERAELASLKSQQLEAQRQMQARSRPRTHAIPPRTHPDQCIPSRPHSTR